MSWIESIPYEKAVGKLKAIYDRLSGGQKPIDHVLTVHGLRPHTLEGHLSLYRSVLHHSSNSLSPWFLEAIGTYVSVINGCEYCKVHHLRGIKNKLNDNSKFIEIQLAFQNKTLEIVFDNREVAAFDYARKLTETPTSIQSSDIANLHKSGWNDGEILEINQVVAYFNYANRTVLGLGVCLEEP